MDITPAEMKIGDKLMLGKYGVNNNSPQPIVWLKASPDLNFITKNVIDYLCFDGKEYLSDDGYCRGCGNNKYALSNIHSFLNSDIESWYHQTHETDAPPNRTTGGYKNHYGFLYHFEDYEIDSMMFDTITVDGENVCSLIRLPLSSEIIGVNKFPLFARPGTISRMGEVDALAPSNPCGIRPVCKLKSDIPLEMDESGVYHIKPYTIQQNICTSDELLNFLGIAQF